MLRNEGIAQLSEKLAEPVNEDINSLLKAKEIYDDFLPPIIKNYSKFNNARQNEILYEKRKRFEALCYKIGHWFILFALTNSTNKLCSELAAKAILSLENKKDLLSKEEIIKLISESIKLDLGSYLYNLTNPFTNNSFQLITIQDLLELVNITTKDLYENIFEMNHILRLIEATQKNNLDLFVQEMQEIVGCKMTDAEIKEEFNLHYEIWNDSNKNQFGEFYNRLADVYSKWDNTRHPILQWALTYVLDPVDLINDEIMYFGFLDDMLVMDSALYLI